MLRAKRYSYLKENNCEDKKAKGIKKCVIKRNLKQTARVLYSFVPNKSFGQLLDTSPENFIFLKTLDS